MSETLLEYLARGSLRTLLSAAGSHIAGKVAGTYGFGYGDPLAISGTGILYPLATVQLLSTKLPTATGLAPGLYIEAELITNDVAPTGNFTVGLHPITRPATSGGAGLCIYTIGAAVAGSGVVFTTPAADSALRSVGASFAVPVDGIYVLGCVTTATVATSAHVHINAKLLTKDT